MSSQETWNFHMKNTFHAIYVTLRYAFSALCNEDEQCEVCTVAIDVPTRYTKEYEQLEAEELARIISCLEDPDKNANYINWVKRGYLMNQGDLYRFAPDSDSEDAQLVDPSHKRTLIPKNHHDAPMADHCGAEGPHT
ncbi:integrase_H2C2 domain-containing protein [Trichonephila clavipes]|uniref:Integrase_H2C2 domain-containing protein n=1 Tax=Trichonephila clavipes TaxID=2585209 RepID=A0A8X7BJE4_TRICX|nr:integrase_H2C2 domain-containing protein [Trichonephila clavipes]